MSRTPGIARHSAIYLTVRSVARAFDTVRETYSRDSYLVNIQHSSILSRVYMIKRILASIRFYIRVIDSYLSFPFFLVLRIFVESRCTKCPCLYRFVDIHLIERLSDRSSCQGTLRISDLLISMSADMFSHVCASFSLLFPKPCFYERE